MWKESVDTGLLPVYWDAVEQNKFNPSDEELNILKQETEKFTEKMMGRKWVMSFT